MEHPLITNIDHLTMEELQDRVNDLYKKLAYAHRTGNQNLRGQIQMALETFQTKLREKQQAQEEQQRRKGTDFSDKIDIS